MPPNIVLIPSQTEQPKDIFPNKLTVMGTMNNGILRKLPLARGLCMAVLSFSFGVNGIGNGGTMLRTSQMRMFASSGATVEAEGDSKASMVATGRDLILLEDEEYSSQSPTLSSSPTITAFPTSPPSRSRSPSTQPTGAPSGLPTEIPTEQPTEQPTETPTQQPTEQPTGAPTMAPTMMPTSLSFSEKMQKKFPRALAWAMLIPLASISCIVWAVRQQPVNKKGRKLCVDIMLEDPIPNEIVFPNENSIPDVELVPASTWKTSEEWEGTGGSAAGSVPLAPSDERSDLSTDYIKML